MPNYKGHLVGGVVAYGITLYALKDYNPSLFSAAQWLGFALAGSLFPDIDIKSKGQKYFYAATLLGLCILLIKKQFTLFACVSIASFTPMLVHHRGLFHRLWFIILMAIGIWLLISSHFPRYEQPLMFDLIFFVAGAISHLWLDLGLRKMFRF